LQLKVPRTRVETLGLERKEQWLWLWQAGEKENMGSGLLARQAETLSSASGEAPFTYPTPLGWRTVGAPSSLYLELGVLIGIEAIHCRILNAGR
jgi:hypothetical protein